MAIWKRIKGWLGNPDWVTVIIALVAVGLSIYSTFRVSTLEKTFSLSIEPMAGEVKVEDLSKLNDIEPLDMVISVGDIKGYEHEVTLITGEIPSGIDVEIGPDNGDTPPFKINITINPSSNLISGKYMIPLIGIGGDGQQKSCCYILTVEVPPKPEIKIIKPWDKEIVYRQETLTGTSQYIPEGYKLWAVVFPKEIGRYYPQEEPIEIDGQGAWTTDISIGTEVDEGEMFRIIVVLADKICQDCFTDYIKDCEEKQSWSGMEELPEDAKELEYITVTRHVSSTSLPAPTPTPTSTPTPTPSSTPEPAVKITTPSEGSYVGTTQLVSGTSQNIPAGYEIRVMIYSQGIDRYYPQDKPADIGINGDWTKYVFIGNESDAGKQFDIVVMLADEKAQEYLDDYIEDCIEKGNYPGLETLSEGLSEHDRITVTRQ